jgi:enolase-phosphatase E1
LIQLEPSQILFLSDNVKEVDAAHQVKMESIVVDRAGNAPLSAEDKARFDIVESLSEIK